MTKEKFTLLVLNCEETLYRISVSMLKNERDAEDATQTAILKAFEKISTLKDEKYFKTWLVRILINVCNKQLKEKSKYTCNDIDLITLKSCDNNFEVRVAVENLPLKIRQVVVLYYIEQFSTKEISSMLKIPKGTVLSRLSKGRELLKLELK
ncbi:MAG: RNA polymerase sigma factor [Ruminococcus sp.]|nr:RNA polymerase sigma factor [Ruminococcus sp.]